MYSLLGRLSGQTLKHLRGDREVQKIAESAGVSSEIWRVWENGEQIPPPQNSAGILRGLDCSEADYKRAFLIAAQAVREFRRSEALRDTGIPEFEDFADGVKSALYGHLAMYDALEKIAKSPDLLQVVKLTRSTPTETAR